MTFDVDVLLDELADRVADRLASSNGHEPESEPWRLHDLEDAAARFGRSTRWVRDRVKAGELSCVRLDGGAFAFLLDDLIAFAEARRIGGSELER